jgi:ubiquinone/menaquinone biosynthesis C-methylase UbiE
MPAEDSKALSRKRFKQYAQEYVDSMTHAAGADLDRLFEIAKPLHKWIVLDIATGGGHTALKLAPSVAKVVATDLTLKMLQAAQAFIRSRGVRNVHFQIADAENLPFKSQYFDLVTCRIAAHHFPDVQRFIKESARVLKADAVLLVQDHLLPDDDANARYVDSFEKLRDPSHNRAYNLSEWQTMFKRAGLIVEQIEWVTKHHDFLTWAKRQGCTPEVIAQLREMLVHAPAGALPWMQVQNSETTQASFTNQHILIAGRKRQ